MLIKDIEPLDSSESEPEEDTKQFTNYNEKLIQELIGPLIKPI
jgi:hypothetical protein